MPKDVCSTGLSVKLNEARRYEKYRGAMSNAIWNAIDAVQEEAEKRIIERRSQFQQGLIRGPNTIEDKIREARRYGVSEEDIWKAIDAVQEEVERNIIDERRRDRPKGLKAV